MGIKTGGRERGRKGGRREEGNQEGRGAGREGKGTRGKEGRGGGRRGNETRKDGDPLGRLSVVSTCAECRPAAPIVRASCYYFKMSRSTSKQLVRQSVAAGSRKGAAR